MHSLQYEASGRAPNFAAPQRLRTTELATHVVSSKPAQRMRTQNLLPIAILSLLLAACQDDPKNTPQYKQLQEDSQRIEQVVAEKDSAMNTLFASFNRISENLRTIRTKQGQLLAPTGGIEGGGTIEDRIMDDIAEIDLLLAENRALIERMRGQSKSSAANISELKGTLAELERSMAERDAEIADLKEELASSNNSLATLIAMYRDKTQLADMQRSELNTAYYAVGTAKELRENGVLSKEGGLAGIGGVNKLNMDNLAKGYFTRVDVLAVQEIPILGKKAKLATAHPEGSYRFEDGAAKLIITDYNTFWSVSKYLVVVVE